MAPNFISKIALLGLTLALCLAALPAPALAASPTDQTPTKEHTIKFYLDPALVPDIQFAKTVLPKYVADMNTILAKNTDRRFIFDPETGIILTNVAPQTNGATPPLPTADFEIWTVAMRTNSSTSYGGYMSMDQSGAGVMAGFYWTQLYDPDNLPAGKVLDYSIQINNMLHELAHIFGAGIGEYYNLANVTDSTGMAPLLNIALSNPTDPFWSDKPDFMTDPLLRLTHSATRADYLATVRYSNLTAAVMNGDYRNGIASFDALTLRVVDQNDLPIAGANVKVWNVTANAPNPSQLLFDSTSGADGQITLPWGGSGNAHGSNNFLRLIKVYKDGNSVAQPRYISIYDADIAKMVSLSALYLVTIHTSTQSPVSSTTARFTSIGAQDGWLLESSKTSKKGGSVNANASTLYLGDDAARRQYRSILSFDTSSLPKNAVITKISLSLKLQGTVGKNPFNTLGNIGVDMRQGAYSNSLALQPGDFQANSSASNVGEILNTPDAGNWYTTDLSDTAFTAVNLSGATQLRLHFSLHDNKDNVANYAKFFSGSADAASRPILTITYTLP